MKVGYVRVSTEEQNTARQKGKYKGRKPIAVDGEKFAEVYRRWKSGEIQGGSVMRELGLKSTTFYRRVRDYETSGHLDCR